MEINLLSNLLKENDGEILFSFLSDTFVSRNKDVEDFLRTKAAQSAKLRTSATYLVYDSSDGIDLLGYFTLATKMFTLYPRNLSSRQQRIVERFVSLDADTDTYRMPAVLLAQFGRNFSESSKSVSGNRLMRVASGCTEAAVSLTSGKVVFLECEQEA